MEYQSKLGRKVDEPLPFKAKEGECNLLYGKMRSGKTYGATADAVEDAKRGNLVYTTWPIAIECFDDRFDFFISLRNLLFFRKRYYRIEGTKNIHYIDATKGEVDGVPTFDPKDPKAYIEYLNTLNHCVLYIDEAWRVIDSYKGTSFGLEARNLILVTGHQFRTVNLIAQRPTSVHVTARGNVNRFYKYEKMLRWPIIIFRRTEFQDMIGETVDETKPMSTKLYIARRRIFNAYNTHFYGDLKPIHEVEAEVFHLGFGERIQALIASIATPFRAFMARKGRR